jgi:hypothetical protein
MEIDFAINESLHASDLRYCRKINHYTFLNKISFCGKYRTLTTLQLTTLYENKVLPNFSINELINLLKTQ